MKKIVLILAFSFVSLFANFFIMDKGRIVEITNEPSKDVKIVGDNGKVLKKHKTLSSAKKEQQKYFSKKKKVKVKKYTKLNKKKYRKYKKYSKINKKRYLKRHKKYSKVYKKRKYTKKYKKYLKKKYAKRIIKDLIVIRTSKRILEFYKNGRWYKNYKIAVGKAGWRVYGTFKIRKKVKWPNWIPTKRIREENPRLPSIVYGGPKNPLGARALYLGYSKVRIHGTNNPKSIGKAVSHGCFRMRNKDVKELYRLVKIGTPVYIK